MQASPKRRKRSKGADAGGSFSARRLRIAAMELLQVLPSAACGHCTRDISLITSKSIMLCTTAAGGVVHASHTACSDSMTACSSAHAVHRDLGAANQAAACCFREASAWGRRALGRCSASPTPTSWRLPAASVPGGLCRCARLPRSWLVASHVEGTVTGWVAAQGAGISRLGLPKPGRGKP